MRWPATASATAEIGTTTAPERIRALATVDTPALRAAVRLADNRHKPLDPTEGPIPMSWTIGRKLGAAFGAVCALFALALAATLVYAQKANTQWAEAVAIGRANEGAAAQREGTRAQMSAQAHLAATMDPKFERDFEQGVAASDAGAKHVEALHDPQVTAISASANTADHTHDATITKELFPAVEHGDQPAALAALKKADAAVGIVFGKLQSIGAHINKRHEAAVASAKAASASARRFGILAGLLAVLMAAGAAFFVVRGIRRGVTAILDRLGSLTGDADALARALDAAATGDLTVSVAPTTEPIEHFSSDEIGRVAEAVNTIRDANESSTDAYNRMVGGLRELISDVSTAAGTVSASSQQMAGTADEAGRAVGEIAHAIGEVAHGAEAQVRSVAASRALSDELSDASRQHGRGDGRGRRPCAGARHAGSDRRAGRHRGDGVRALGVRRRDDDDPRSRPPLGGDHRHRVHDHRHRRADEPAGAQRRDRGGARRRAGPRLRGRRRGGAQARRGVPGGGGDDRRPDRRDPA
jgi:methyl-accepting chemotaxis protein